MGLKKEQEERDRRREEMTNFNKQRAWRIKGMSMGLTNLLGIYY